MSSDCCDVERARLAVGVDAVPIEEAKRGVAGLLDFGDEQAGAESMHGAGFDEQAVADARLELRAGMTRSCRGPIRVRASRGRRPA